jgi:hypothetical protein
MTAPAIPENLLTFIKECVSHNRIYWTYHVNMRMRNRFVSREMILQSFQKYEIIESYPTDKYLPSYLVFSKHEDITFHVLFAVDVAEQNVRIITAYIPDPGLWDHELKRRKNR